MDAAVATTSFIPAVNLPHGTKVCNRCFDTKPETSFDTTPSGGREGTCRACRRKADKIRLATGAETAHQRNIAEKLAALITQLNEDHPDVPSISTLMAKLIAKLGSVDGFVSEWAKRLLSDKVSAIAQLDGFKAIAKFCEKAGEQNKALDGLRNLTNVDLNNFILSMLVDQNGEDSDQALIDALQQKLASKGQKLLVVDSASIVDVDSAPPAAPSPAPEGSV